jgi:hypothetical protein
VAFTVIVVFVVAQVTWWILVQGRLANELRDTTIQAWELDARTANAVLALDPAAEADAARALRAPAADGGRRRLEVDPRRAPRGRAAQRPHGRMLAFEGPFFALVILGLLLFIAGSLRAERELKRRQRTSCRRSRTSSRPRSARCGCWSRRCGSGRRRDAPAGLPAPHGGPRSTGWSAPASRCSRPHGSSRPASRRRWRPPS